MAYHLACDMEEHSWKVAVAKVTQDYSKLTSRQIDVLIAERAMGWKWRQRVGDTAMFLLPPERPDKDDGTQVPVGDMKIPEHAPTPADRAHTAAWGSMPRFSTDDNAVRLVRDRVAELGLQKKYAVAFFLVVFPGRTEMVMQWEDFWAFMQATPRQQCEAALKAMEAK